jgi:hypothetical protein
MSSDSPWGEIIGMRTGPPLIVHSPDVCTGRHCCIHNPSEHPLNGSPLNWRGHVMERVCGHGVGHPDPDDRAWRRQTGRPTADVHGCDGCCAGFGPRPIAPPAGRAVSAPWTPGQVDSLNGYQVSGLMHPYTCPGRLVGHREGSVLTATVAGWVCPDCGYRQDWAHRWSVDGTWEQLQGPVAGDNVQGDE